MADQRLLDFIKNELEKDTKKSVIRNRLLESGWSSQQIEGAFRELENQENSSNKNNIMYLSLALVSLVAVSGFFLLDPANIFSGNQEYPKNKSSTGNLEGDNKISSLEDIIKAGEFECHGKFKGNYKGKERNMDIDIWVKENNSKVLLTKDDSKIGYMVKGTELYTYIVNWTGPYDRNLKQKNRLSSRQRISEMSEYNNKSFCFESDISGDQFELTQPSEPSPENDKQEEEISNKQENVDVWNKYGETLCSNDKYSTKLVYTDLINNDYPEETFCDGLDDTILVGLDKSSLNSIYDKEVDWEKLLELGCLERLKILPNAQFASFSDLKNLKKLKSLVLDRNSIDNFNFLRDLNSLDCLSLKETNFSESSVLSSLNLKKLDLSGTNLSDFSGVKNQKDLTYLELDGRNLADLSFVERFKNLKHLSITGKIALKDTVTGLYPDKDDYEIEKSPVSDLSHLRSLKGLKYLDLSATNVKDISPLKDLKNLTKISLAHTKVTDISPLKEISGLKKVNLAYNNISDFSPLMNLKEPAEWIEINLIGTGISDNQCDKLQDKYGFDNVLC